jgi:hypothetical protein
MNRKIGKKIFYNPVNPQIYRSLIVFRFCMQFFSEKHLAGSFMYVLFSSLNIYYYLIYFYLEIINI